LTVRIVETRPEEGEIELILWHKIWKKIVENEEQERKMKRELVEGIIIEELEVRE